MHRRPLALALVAAGVVAAIAASFPLMPPSDPRYAANCPAGGCRGVAGQWNLFDDTPVPGIPHASGISATRAWQTTVGDPRVVIGVLDSGVNYDHQDLRNKVWLNRGELPVPQGTRCPCAAPVPGDPWDCNADGVFTVQDYACDARVTVDGSGIDRGDLRLFADGVDTDQNGYVDDLSGWDSDDDDGDEFDHRYFGHGTGRAGIAAPETDNLLGVAGVCPRCPLMSVRIDDTFVCTSEGLAKGVVYAVDNGARVLNMSLGALSGSTMLRSAFDYATKRNVLALNASANEFSFHHNFASIFDDVMTIGGVTANDRGTTRTWMQKASFSNYGAHLDVVAPTDVPAAEMGGRLANGDPQINDYGSSASGTSSSTPHAAGVAALVFSRARELIDQGLLPTDGLALPDLSAQEVRQIINATADDVTPDDRTDYPVSVGWDKWTGYGRINAARAVERVSATAIPPEADINTPDWYSEIDGRVQITYYANARWATSYSATVDVGAGVEPERFTELLFIRDQPAFKDRSSVNPVVHFAFFDTRPLPNGLYTLRLRVTDDLGNRGEDRMAVWVRHPDPQDLPAFPRTLPGSLESLSVALVDLNDDNRLDIVLAGGNGQVHALQHTGQPLPGFPVHTDLPRHLPVDTSPAFDHDASNGEVVLSWASVIGGPAVGDLDADGRQEIVVGAADGQVYCWRADAGLCPGFPVSTDPGQSRQQYAPHGQVENPSRGEGIGGAPALGDLDGDGRLEIVVGSADQKLYVWRADGRRMAPFPIPVVVPGGRVSTVAPRAIASSAAIADVDNDGFNDIVIGSNETFGTDAQCTFGGSARAYAFRRNGTLVPGWPIKMCSLQPDAVPQVAQGTGSAPVVADVDGDGTFEVLIAPFLGAPAAYRGDGTSFVAMAPTSSTGPGSRDTDEATPEGGLAAARDATAGFYTGQGAVADIDGDGQLDYLAPMIGSGLYQFINGSGIRLHFDHLLAAWTARTGTQHRTWPRVMEDWQFFTGPATADVTGDGRPEVIATSAGFYVHAFQQDGSEAPGWPKLTGHWQTATPSVGDLDGDGRLEVVQATRLGVLHAWTTDGAACQESGWRKFRHDEWNTGTFGTDTRRPARVTDLRADAEGDQVRLRWTAVGDDAGCGMASFYDLRVSTSPIDRAGFARATHLDVAPPHAAGIGEERLVTPPAGARYFALRTIDDVGNAGPIATAELPPPTTSTSTTSTSTTSTTSTSTTASTLAPTTTTTLPASPVCPPSCDDGNACTDDACDPRNGVCTHLEPPATTSASVVCAVDNLRALLANPQPQCTGRCKCSFTARLDAVTAKLDAATPATTAKKCRRAVTAARKRAARLQRSIAKLARPKCGSDTGVRGVQAALDAAAADLVARATALAPDTFCARR